MADTAEGPEDRAVETAKARTRSLVRRLLDEHSLDKAELARRLGGQPDRIDALLAGDADPTIGELARVVFAISGRECEPVTTKEYMWFRLRAYAAEKFISRLLGIGLNQVVLEADRRLFHPLGLPTEPTDHEEEWQGTRRQWKQINVAILQGAVARLQADTGQHPCQCAECRNVWIDLDSEPPDLQGRALKPGEPLPYSRVVGLSNRDEDPSPTHGGNT